MFIYLRLFGFNFLAKRAAESSFFSSRLLQGVSDSHTLHFLSFFFFPVCKITGTVYDKQSLPCSHGLSCLFGRPARCTLRFWTSRQTQRRVWQRRVWQPRAAWCILAGLKRKMNHNRVLKSENRQEAVRGQEKVFPPGDETLVSRLKSRTMGNNWEQS